MATVLSRIQQRFMQVEAVYGTINNTTGTATVAGANCCLVEPGSILKPVQPEIIRPDKLGTRSVLVGVGARKTATWTHKQSMAANGALGVVPDCDPILQMLFGVAPTIVASTSVTYNFSDAILSGSFFDFYTGISNAPHAIGGGLVLSTIDFTIGGNFGEISASGDGKHVLFRPNFTATDTTGKMGLTAFPVIPASPVTNGIPATGFLGSFVIDGQTLSTQLSAKITATPGNVVLRDTWGSYYGTTPAGDVRTVTVDMEMYMDDQAALIDLMQKADAKTPINATIVCGATAGNIWTFTLNNLILPAPDVDDSSLLYKAKFTGCRAHATTLTSKNELILAIT